MEKIKLKDVAKYAVLLILLTFILYRFDAFKSLITGMISVFSPFIAGFIIALFVNVPSKVINKFLNKTPVEKVGPKGVWALSILISFIFIFLIFSLVFGSVLPDVVRSLINALEQFPAIVDDVVTWYYSLDFEAFKVDTEVLNQIEGFLVDISNELLNWLRNSTTKIISTSVSMISNIFSLLINVVLALIFCIYLLISKARLRKQSVKFFYAFLDDEHAEIVVQLMRRVNVIFYNFLSGLGVEAIIYGILSFIVMKLLSMPYASSISMINALCTFIPYFGAFFGGAIGIILIMTQSVKQAFIFLIMTIILQQLEGNIIYPRVVGDKVGLPGIWVMASVSIGGTIAGLVGMLLAVPVTTFAYLTLKDVVDYRLMRKERKAVKLSGVMTETNDISSGEKEPTERYK